MSSDGGFLFSLVSHTISHEHKSCGYSHAQEGEVYMGVGECHFYDAGVGGPYDFGKGAPLYLQEKGCLVTF